MSSVGVGLIAFACIFGGALLGMFLRAHLPEHHQSADSQRIVNLGAGIIGMMAALVLGLLACCHSRYSVHGRFFPEPPYSATLAPSATGEPLEAMWMVPNVFLHLVAAVVWRVGWM